jgi:precorrin-4/cobalt-precorrin-4 C11-methyltransferase
MGLRVRHPAGPARRGGGVPGRRRAKAKEARIARTALVLVGPALAGESTAESRLYAADHHHSMRPRRA